MRLRAGVGPDAMDPRTELFVGLSERLTGFNRVTLLGTEMSAAYLRAMDAVLPAAMMDKLLADERSLDDAGLGAILDEARLGPVARNIMLLWYCGTWTRCPTIGTPRTGSRRRTPPGSSRPPPTRPGCSGPSSGLIRPAPVSRVSAPGPSAPQTSLGARTGTTSPTMSSSSAPGSPDPLLAKRLTLAGLRVLVLEAGPGTRVDVRQLHPTRREPSTRPPQGRRVGVAACRGRSAAGRPRRARRRRLLRPERSAALRQHVHAAQGGHRCTGSGSRCACCPRTSPCDPATASAGIGRWTTRASSRTTARPSTRSGSRLMSPIRPTTVSSSPRATTTRCNGSRPATPTRCWPLPSTACRPVSAASPVAVKIRSYPAARNSMPRNGYRAVGAVDERDVRPGLGRDLGQRCAGNTVLHPDLPDPGQVQRREVAGPGRSPQAAACSRRPWRQQDPRRLRQRRGHGRGVPALRRPASPRHTVHVARAGRTCWPRTRSRTPSSCWPPDYQGRSDLIGRNLMDHPSIYGWGLAPARVGAVPRTAVHLGDRRRARRRVPRPARGLPRRYRQRRLAGRDRCARQHGRRRGGHAAAVRRRAGRSSAVGAVATGALLAERRAAAVPRQQGAVSIRATSTPRQPTPGDQLRHRRLHPRRHGGSHTLLPGRLPPARHRGRQRPGRGHVVPHRALRQDRSTATTAWGTSPAPTSWATTPRLGRRRRSAELGAPQPVVWSASGSFPTMGTSNPTLTLAALALRTADRLRRTE